MNEWIKVTDRLPEEGLKVLTYDFEIKIDYIIYLNDTEHIWACRLERDENKVRFWMPLSNPPKEKE